MSEKTNEYKDRLEKLKKLREQGIKPYPSKSKRNNTVKDISDYFNILLESQKVVTLAGRLRSLRAHGNLIFANLDNAGYQIQLAISKKEIGADYFKTFNKLIDMGDFIEVSGTCFVTHKGENSVMVKNWKILSKALRPLPDKWHGLKDDDERYRKRYLDMIFNKELRDTFILRSKFWDITRQFMKQKGFFEVETPTLETTTGGAEATPFKTYHEDYDIDVFLRISIGELWQKRLMAAGFEKTFEIGRAYRNEGSSPDHLQEFTNMEFYWSYANYRDGMELSKELYRTIAKEVFNTFTFEARGMKFDLSDDWEEIDYRGEILKQTKIDILKSNEQEMKIKLDELKVKYEGDNKERLTDSLWKHCRKNIIGPAFLLNHPKLVSPLAKDNADLPGTVERFQIILAGSEIGNGYSELNDPLEQKARFELQKKLLESGDTEAMMPDWEFVEMLEYGMPPTCGFGFGERLFAMMVNKPLREVTLFPLLKPKIIPEDTKELIKKE
jgi:lysyl-tRNA synthetase class 2